MRNWNHQGEFDEMVAQLESFCAAQMSLEKLVEKALQEIKDCVDLED